MVPFNKKSTLCYNTLHGIKFRYVAVSIWQLRSVSGLTFSDPIILFFSAMVSTHSNMANVGEGGVTGNGTYDKNRIGWGGHMCNVHLALERAYPYLNWFSKVFDLLHR